MDCNPPGSSVCRIFQARILAWFAIFSSRGSSQHREVTWASCVSYIGRWILYHCATWKAGDMKMIHFDHGMKTKNWIALTRRGQSDYANIPIIKEDLQFVNIFFVILSKNLRKYTKYSLEFSANLTIFSVTQFTRRNYAVMSLVCY